MSSLLGILQLDRGDPWGYGQLSGLVQAWLQDAGGFAAVGLVVYLLYALSTPTNKSQSEKLRVPVSQWMLALAGLALIAYALWAATFFYQPGVSLKFVGQEWLVAPLPAAKPQPGETVRTDPPSWQTDLQSLALMVSGLFALLSIGEPFARDLLKVVRRNVTFGTGGLVRFWRSLREYSAALLTPNRVISLGAALAAYALVGVALFALGVPGLTAIWTQVLVVGAGLFVCSLLLLMLFEAEGPVWAIAKLSFKEAVRSQVLWIFLIAFLPFLFPAQSLFTGGSKPSDEMRATTSLVTVLLSFLALMPALLIASFGIPNDIKNLNIFTVVSKPIERLEIVLGRFVGYTALMTLVTLGLTGVSLIMIANSNASNKARAETYTARVPYRGKLEFKSIVATDRREQREFTGTNVGREFDYRRYITGAPGSSHRAIWKFATVPSELKAPPGDKVGIEFTFDVFRLTKGVQNRGALTKFQIATHNAPLRQPRKNEITQFEAEWPWVDEAAQKEYKAAVARLSTGILIDDTLVNRIKSGATTDEQRAELHLAERMKSLAGRLKAAGVPVTEEANGVVRTDPANVSDPRSNGPAWKAVNALAEEFGFFELAGKEVFDYQVMNIEVPAGLFRNALATEPGKEQPRLTVYVKCEDEGQMLGAAEPDLYILQSEMPYEVNFLKGSVGLWCRLCIVIGVAVALSTYLSGVLALLGTALIYVVGFFTDHLTELAQNRSVGGGPFQSISQLVKAEQPTTPLSDSASTKAIQFGDRFWAWVIRRIQNMIPDVDAFSWGHFVSEGFNVNTEYLAINVLVMCGYLLPWLILAYYLMKSREVAA